LDAFVIFKMLTKYDNNFVPSYKMGLLFILLWSPILQQCLKQQYFTTIKNWSKERNLV